MLGNAIFTTVVSRKITSSTAVISTSAAMRPVVVRLSIRHAFH
ncbi:hypothetical protein [Micromonospora sp. 4G55]|nr:hypothetical protein [Micromonospora sp. 4G55]